MYDKKLAQEAVDWFPRYLRHTKGPWQGVPFELLPWQEDIIRRLYGTVKADGTRQYRQAYVEVPKKNGKSELAGGVALKSLLNDHEKGAEVYSAAADREQASIVFNVAANMVRLNPVLGQRCKIIDSTKRIVHNTNLGAFYRVLSSDVKTKHGFNSHAVVFDELHTQPNRDLWDVLTKFSGAARPQPLVFVITTAGYDRNSICWDRHDYALKVISGVVKDPTFLAVVYHAEDSEDWTDEKVWEKANPSIGHILRLDDFRADCTAAQESPADENIFRRLRLNQWTKQETRWLPMEKWLHECNGPVDEEELKAVPCWAGLDLASTEDIAAFVMAFIHEGLVKLMCRFWIPKDNIEKRSKNHGVHYEDWVRKGYIVATEGASISFDRIEKDIIELADVYDIQGIAIDPHNATATYQHLEAAGLEALLLRQGFGQMNEPTKELLRLVLGGLLRHGDNPVLTWMADNLVVITNEDLEVRPAKKRSTEKIDGISATVNALSLLKLHETPQRSVYEDRGVVVV